MTPPDHLSADARAFYSGLAAEYSINDAGGLALLQAASEAYMRAGEARAIIERDGPLVTDRHGQLVQHPAVRMELAARAQMLTALKQLRLDVEPLKAVGRPGVPTSPDWRAFSTKGA